MSQWKFACQDISHRCELSADFVPRCAVRVAQPEHEAMDLSVVWANQRHSHADALFRCAFHATLSKGSLFITGFSDDFALNGCPER